uniref:C2H2-type domain-containing protein n=1 Tax=Graphocephala atropunctata TaxID=36148 RepID=A0A1B6MQF0_9HEMI
MTRYTSPSSMEEPENICFVCDRTIPSEKWMYKLQETATKKRNVPVADLIKQLVGDEYVVFVGEEDAICSKCMNMLNLMDSLTAQLGEVQSSLSQLLHSKYNLASETVQIQYDETKVEETEPILKCESCDFQTKYEKEFNMHVRIHAILTPPVVLLPKSADSNTPKVNLLSSPKVNLLSSPKVNSTKKARGRPIKATPKSVIKPKKTPPKKKPKQKKTPKPKKTKVVYQCSVCDKIFPEEAMIRDHAKNDHGNENIVVSDEDEYEDLQTLDDEEAPVKESPVQKKSPTKPKPALKKKSPMKKKSLQKKKPQPKKQTKKKRQSNDVKTDLDFLDDWEEDDENDDIQSPAKKIKTNVPNTETNRETRKSVEEIEEDDNENNLTKPTCMFCKATFSSFESVQDHVKLSHGKQTSHLNVGSKTGPATQGSIASFEIDSTTDIVDKKATVSSDGTKSSQKSFKCNLCGIRKVSLQFIQRHIKIHKKLTSLQCKSCGFSCRSISALKIHASKCTKLISIAKKCRYCKFKFFDKVQLKNHVRKVHHNKGKVDHRKDPKANNQTSKVLQNPVSKGSINKKTPCSMNALEISISEVSSTSFYIGTSVKKETPVENDDIAKGKEKDFQSAINRSRKKVTPKCEECGAEFLKQSSLLDHINRHKAKACWDLGICIYCGKLFLNKEQLGLHSDLVHSNFKSKPAHCEPCRKTYLHGKDLKNHFLKAHFGESTEKLLKQMSEQASTSDDANDVYSKVFKELQSITGEGNESEDSLVGCQSYPPNYCCSVCSFSSADKSVLENHFKCHKQNYCDICRSLFLPETFISHIENHSIEFQGKTCVECDEKFHDDIHLRFHFQISHSGNTKPFKCCMCVKTFITKKSLVKHECMMHRKTSRPVYFCGECPKSFHSEKRYQIHVGFAHRPIMNCKYCDKSFTEVNKLAFHERHHLKQVKSIYKCNVCGKVLKTLSALKTHKKNNHTSSNSLQCETCEQSFKSFQALREHMAKHSEEQEKKYFCDICGKGFYFYDSHARHRRVHLDPLLFRCRLCSERFQTKQKLIEHKKTCKVVAKCDKCLECFDTIPDLKSHVCLFDDNTVALT